MPQREQSRSPAIIVSMGQPHAATSLAVCTGRRVLRTFVLLALAAGVLFAASCGDDEGKPKAKPASASASVTTSVSTTYRSADWGFAVTYDSRLFALQATEARGSLGLGPSLLTDEQLRLEDCPALELTLPQTEGESPGADVASLPTVAVTVLELPSTAGDDADGLARQALLDWQDSLERSWQGVLADEMRLGEVGGLPAWTYDAVGMDETAGGELRQRVYALAAADHIYTIRLTGRREDWDVIEPRLTALIDSFRLLRDDQEQTAGGGTTTVRQFRFAIARPRGFIPVHDDAQLPKDLVYGLEFVDACHSPLVAYSVGVAAAPEGIGNSQAGLLETFYRSAAGHLREQADVISVQEPRAIGIGGKTAWLLDVTSKLDDGTHIRTRTYDVWQGDLVYSISARGRAAEWATDWQLLEPAVQSFDVL